MNDDIDNAIKAITAKAIAEKTAAHEAIQLTQAALNLAHAKQVLAQIAK